MNRKPIVSTAKELEEKYRIAASQLDDTKEKKAKNETAYNELQDTIREMDEQIAQTRDEIAGTSVAKGKLPEELAALMLNERVAAIKQAGLGKLDEQIAMQYFIERLPHSDVAAIVGRDRSTVSRRLKEITPQIKHAAASLTKIPQ